MPCNNCSCGSEAASSSADKSTSVGVSTGAAVPLPRTKGSAKADSGEANSTSNNVWTLRPPSRGSTTPRSASPSRPAERDEQLQGILGDVQPLARKCGADEREGHQCCKDLKGDDERHLISPEIVRDVIIGLSDGLTVPFALTAGLSSLGSSKLVVTGGLAELCAGAISMGLGGYLASQAELDHFHYLRRQTQARVLRSCSGEMEREVHSILGPLGVKETLSRLVAEDLRSVEDSMYIGGAANYGSATEGVMRGREDSGSGSSGSHSHSPGKKEKKGWFGWKRPSSANAEEREGLLEGGGEAVKGDEDMGMTAFLLKFGEGMEEVPRSRLYISALTIGLSYFIGGLIPLIPYMANVTAQTGLIISSCITGVVLFIFGAFKTYFTGAQGGIGGYLYGATSTMFVGGFAAAAAFLLVKVLDVRE